MWICLCEAVSSGTIRQAIADGATSISEIGRACAAGTVCGRCKGNIAVLLEEHRASASTQTGRTKGS
jgi:bacterioferritin-associated ferredoxin